MFGLSQYNKGIIPIIVNEISCHHPLRFESWRRREAAARVGTAIERLNKAEIPSETLSDRFSNTARIPIPVPIKN